LPSSLEEHEEFITPRLAFFFLSASSRTLLAIPGILLSDSANIVLSSEIKERSTDIDSNLASLFLG
jgi:hypothetical protein